MCNDSMRQVRATFETKSCFPTIGKRIVCPLSKTGLWMYYHSESNHSLDRWRFTIFTLHCASTSGFNIALWKSLHFWAHLCMLHGGLICVAFCLSVWTWPKFSLDQNSYLRSNSVQIKKVSARKLFGPPYSCGLSVGGGLVLWTARAHCQRQVALDVLILLNRVFIKPV